MVLYVRGFIESLTLPLVNHIHLLSRLQRVLFTDTSISCSVMIDQTNLFHKYEFQSIRHIQTVINVLHSIMQKETVAMKKRSKELSMQEVFI